jgi:hypothetical protein
MPQRLPAPGFDPEPASFAPVLFVVPDRLRLPEDGPLPAAPGLAPEPASFGPVLSAVPERLVAPLSAASAGVPAARNPAASRMSLVRTVMAFSLVEPTLGPERHRPASRGNTPFPSLFLGPEQGERSGDMAHVPDPARHEAAGSAPPPVAAVFSRASASGIR